MKNVFLNNLSPEEKQKIRHDVLYSSLTDELIDYGEIQKAGWINTKYSFKETVSHNDLFCFSGESKITLPVERKQSIVLFSTGSYAPAHYGHIEKMILAAQKAESLGYHVSLIILSPSHDNYVLTKAKNIHPYKIETRVVILEKILENYFKDNPDNIKYQRLFHIDLFESTKSKYAINFSEVLTYIEQSLLILYPREAFHFGYVFGDDNISFTAAFNFLDKTKKQKYLAFCIERENQTKKYLSSNIHYISNPKYQMLKSRDIRENQKIYPPTNKSLNSGTYLVREDTNLATQKWCKKYFDQKEQIQESYLQLSKSIFYLISSYVPQNINTILLYEKDQNEIVSELVKTDKKIINLDPCTNQHKDVYPIDFSRLFNISDLQRKPNKITERKATNSRIIMPGTYSFMDDDIASGFTLNTVREKLKLNNIYIDKIYNLSELYLQKKNIPYEKIFDIVDCRDFTLGSFEGGLVSLYRNSQTRIPYIYPWVNLSTRANISQSKEFSLKILELNLHFFKANPYIGINDFHSEILLKKTVMAKFNNKPIELIQYLKRWVETHHS